jgi:hypothetical protein
MATLVVRVVVNSEPITIIHFTLPPIGLLDIVIRAKTEVMDSVVDRLLVIRGLHVSKEVLAIKAKRRRVVVQTSRIVECDEVDLGLVPHVVIEVGMVRRDANIAVKGEILTIDELVDNPVVEEVDGITNLTRKIVGVLGLDCHERVRVVVSNLATVEPIEVTTARQPSSKIVNTERGIARGLNGSTTVLLVGAERRVASPSDIAAMGVLDKVEVVVVDGIRRSNFLPSGERVVARVVDIVDMDVRWEQACNTLLGAEPAEIAINLVGDPDNIIELVNDARSSKRRSNTRKSGAITEILIIALEARVGISENATAVRWIHVRVATLTDLTLKVGAIAVERIASPAVIVGPALGLKRVVVAVQPVNTGRGAAGGDASEVTRVPIVESIAIFVVDAKLRIALPDINKIRGIRGNTVSVERNRTTRAGNLEASIEISAVTLILVNLELLVGLRSLPSVTGRRAAATATGRGDNLTSTDLVRLTIYDPNVGKSNVSRVVVSEVLVNIIQSDEVSVPEERLPNAIDALRSARRPLRPVRKNAVLLNALKLVSALNARSNRI